MACLEHMNRFFARYGDDALQMRATKAVLALASLNEFDASHLAFLEQLTANLGIVLNSIEVTMQTEALLKQSQKLAGELQAQNQMSPYPHKTF